MALVDIDWVKIDWITWKLGRRQEDPTCNRKAYTTFSIFNYQCPAKVLPSTQLANSTAWVWMLDRPMEGFVEGILVPSAFGLFVVLAGTHNYAENSGTAGGVCEKGQRKNDRAYTWCLPWGQKPTKSWIFRWELYRLRVSHWIPSNFMLSTDFNTERIRIVWIEIPFSRQKNKTSIQDPFKTIKCIQQLQF